MINEARRDLLLDLYFSQHPFPAAERRRYRARGFYIHEPDLMPCLMPIGEWHPDSFVATQRKAAELSVLMALKPGRGAWRRLFARLQANGYSPVTVVCPLPPFRDHLAGAGFRGPYPMPGGDLYIWP